jgi:pyruvate/2-oxoglutarate dehydrogenase complex dihydrolipoamide dehydrogenase (E3) component
VKGFDYDLVIVGGSAVGRYAAAIAAQSPRRARVALIEPTPPSLVALHLQTLSYAAQVAHQIRQADLWGFAQPAPAVQWQELAEWTARVWETLAEEQSLERLAAAGIDIVIGQGEFCARGFSVQGRVLRSRTYLLVPASQPAIPPIPGLADINYLIVESLIKLPTRPDRLIILSREPAGIELAQSLSRLGTQVTLITENESLLPQADPAAMNLLQTELEIEGVTILSQTQVMQVGQQGEQKRIRIGEKILEADEILVVMGRSSDLVSLKLEPISVRWNDSGIPVNRYLQTSNTSVYASGETLGGYAIPHLAEYEAAIAVHNALNASKRQTKYQLIPWAVQTQPEYAQVGLTEAQARKLYPDVQILRQPWRILEKAAIQSQTTGFCQIIVRRSGVILGAQMVGMGGSEAIAVIALAMRSNLKVGAIAQIPVTPTFHPIIRQTAQQWRRSPSE